MTIPTGDWSAIIACAVLAYLCGSIPFGLIFSRLAGHGDIRAIGSGNIGATNVLRTGSKTLAAATLICDMLKGFFPVLIAWRFGADAATAAAVGAIIGHIFPVWLGFKGGKGVATAGGVLLAYAWPIAAGRHPHLDRDGARVPLLLAGRRDRRHRRADLRLDRAARGRRSRSPFSSSR